MSAMPPPPPNMSAPPGYIAYGGSNQGAYASFQRIGGVARWLGITLIVLVPVLLLAVLKSFGDRTKAQDFLAGKISEGSFKRDIGATALLGLLSAAVLIATAVLTIIWMYRIAKNLQALNRVGTWKPGWAIGGWFVPPFILYVVPFLMLRDLWKGSDPDSGHDWRTNRVGAIVNIWWVLYGLAPVLFLSVTFSNFSVSRSTTSAANQLVDRFGVSIGSSVLQIASAVTFLLLVRQLTARHQQLINESQ